MSVNVLEWSILNDALQRKANEIGLQKPRHAFPYFVCSKIFDIPDEEIDDLITDGPMDHGVDILYFEERSDSFVIHIMNLKYGETEKSSNRNFPGDELSKLKDFLHCLLTKNKSLQKNCHEKLYEKVKYIWSKFGPPDFEIRLYLCSNLRPLIQHERSGFDKYIENKNYIYLHEYTLEHLVQTWIRKQHQPINRLIQVVEYQRFARIDGSYRGLICTVKGSELVEAVRDPGNHERILRAAFNDNIRVFLGMKNTVNQNIFDTIVGDQRQDFWYLNNGVTIVCERFSYNDGIPSACVEIRDLQIVNGGQTTNALFEAQKINPDAVNNVFLLVKIFEADDERIKLKIAEATNTQTSIRGRDLRSNHPIQKRLEEGFLSHGYYYERKKDQHSDKSTNQKIDALRSGQLYMAFYLGEPDKAKTQSDQIFGEHFDKIFNNNITIEKLLSCVILGKILDQMKQDAKKAVRIGSHGSKKNEFIIEGTFHVLFVLGLICDRDSIKREDFPKIHDKIEEALNITREVSEPYRPVSFYKFFRSVRAKEALREAVTPMSPSLFS